MKYFDKCRAVCAIGEALKRSGWNLVGYREDQSDMMTDYYHPASWEGVATNDWLPDIVVCVGVSSADKSGREEIGSRSEKGADCDRCNTTGVEPGALTYDEARLNPQQQHQVLNALRHGARMLFPDVVSPLAYLEDGSPRCEKCSGRGHGLKSVDFVRWVWPVYHEVAKGMAWHIEIGGKVAFSGKGFAGCERDSNQDHSAADAIAVEIKGAAHLAKVRYGKAGVFVQAAAPTPQSGQLSTLDGITVEQERDWTWVKFPSVPSVDVRAALQAQYDARFSGKRQAWYIRQAVDIDAVAETIRKAMPVRQVTHETVVA